MDDNTAAAPQPEPQAPPAQLSSPVAPVTAAPAQPAEPHYEGNSFDLYALIAAILGITSLAMCFSGNMLLYCLPFVPLVFGIIALRNSPRALNPSRVRTMGWIGVAAGAVGLVLVLIVVLFLTAYLVFIFSFFGEFMRNMPRRP